MLMNENNKVKMVAHEPSTGICSNIFNCAYMQLNLQIVTTKLDCNVLISTLSQTRSYISFRSTLGLYLVGLPS